MTAHGSFLVGRKSARRAGPCIRPRTAIRGRSRRHSRALRHAGGMPQAHAHAALCAARPRRTTWPRRDPRQGREPALRLRRLQGAGRRFRHLQRALRRGRRGWSGKRDLRRPDERQASRDHLDIHLRHGELGQPWPLGRRRRQAVRQSLRRLPAEIHQRREGSGDPRPRRRGDQDRRRLRRRRRRVSRQVRGEWLDHHLRHVVGGLRCRCHAASCAAIACWPTRRSCSNGRRAPRMCSSRPA